MRRTLNFRLVAVLLLATAALGAGLFALNRFQQRRGARSFLMRADLAEKKQDREAAEAALTRYIALRPDDAEVRSRYGLMLDKQAADAGGRQRALAALENALRVDPSRKDVRRHAAGLAMKLGLDRDARGHLEILLREAPGDGELEAMLGECEERLGRFAEADALYLKAIEHAPHLVATYPRRAALLRSHLRRADEADRIMDARELAPGKAGVVGANPDSADAHLARARYRAAFKMAGAEADVARAREIAPKSLEVLVAAADSALQGGRIEEARKFLGEGLALDPKDVRIYRGLGAIELRAGRPEAALEEFGRGIKALGGPEAPEALELRWLRAGTLISAGKAEEARAELDAFRRKNDIAPAPLDYLEGQILLGLRRWDDAARVLERVRAQSLVAVNQSDLVPMADALLPLCYEGMGRFDRQLEVARRALVRDPESTPARVAEASSLAALGRIDEALDAYRKLAPEVPAVRTEIARLTLIRESRRPEAQRRPEEVDRALADAARPDGPDTSLLGAEALLLRGKADAARDLILKARDRTPDKPELWVALAQLEARRGGPDPASKVLDEADAKLGPQVDLRLARADLLAQRGGPDASPALRALVKGIDEVPAPDRTRLQDGLADAFARVGEVAEARKLWSDLADKKPDDLRLAQILFDLAIAPGEGPDRDAELRKAVERFRKIEGEGGSLWRFAEASRQLDGAKATDKARLEEARRLLGEASKIRPDWASTSLLDAALAEREGDRDRAIASYLKAIDLGERRPDVVRRAVGLLNERGRFEDADRALRSLGEGDLAVGMLGRLAAEQSFRVQDRQRALEMARAAVPAGSKDPGDHLWLGQMYAAAGRQDEAEAEFRKAIALDEARPESRVALVQFLARAGRKAKAEAAVDEARARFSAAEPLALATCESIVGHAAVAEKLYLAELAKRPEDADLLRAVAGYYMASDRPGKAEPLLRKVLAGAPASDPKAVPAARRALAMALAGDRRQGEALSLIDANLEAGGVEDDRRMRALLLAGSPGLRAEAIAAFEGLAKLRPAPPAERFLLARLLSDDHEWARAIAILADLLASDGENPGYLAAYADALISDGRPSEAEEPAGRLAQAAPKALGSFVVRARLLKAQGKPTEAVAALEDYARDGGEDIPALARMIEEIDAAAAEPMFRRAAADPKRPEGLLNLALYLGRLGRVREALDACERARETCPAEAVSSACLAMLSAAHAGPEHARRVEPWLRAAIRKDPRNTPLQFDLTNLLDIEQDYAGMEAALRRLVDADPGKSGPLHNLGWLLAVRGDAKGEAVGLVDRAIALEGPVPNFLDTRAMAYLAGGRPDRAAKDLDALAAAHPSGEVLFHLARARRAAGDRDAAAVALRRAKALGFDEMALHTLERPAYRQLCAELGGK